MTNNTQLPTATAMINASLAGAYRLAERSAIHFARFEQADGSLYLTIETADTKSIGTITAEIRISNDYGDWQSNVSWYGIGGRDTDGARRQATLILLASNLADAIVADLNAAAVAEPATEEIPIEIKITIPAGTRVRQVVGRHTLETSLEESLTVVAERIGGGDAAEYRFWDDVGETEYFVPASAVEVFVRG